MVRFSCNGSRVESGAPPHTTLLEWLRASGRVGTKEGCAEGDCGACTVLVLEPDGRLRAINSCLVLLPQVHGRALFTVEGLAADGVLHPAQQAMVDALGSQCGFCTPGFVMSLAEACHRTDLDAPWKLDDQLCGNLCRCTGYRPIREAGRAIAGSSPADAIARACAAPPVVDRPFGLEIAGERYFAPIDLQGVWAARAAAPDATLVAGATDLGLDVTQKHRRFPALVDLSRVAELRGITRADGAFRLGAAVPLADLEAWSERELPLLHRMLRYFGSRQIKHRATMGGNLCTASPIGDLAPVLLALDAHVEIAGPNGARTLAMHSFFEGYRRTALAPDEILAAVHVAAPPAQARVGAYKVSRRRELDISAVSACFRVQLDDDGRVAAARLAFGGMAATPIRAVRAERELVGLGWDESAAERAAAEVGRELTPLTDHRGSAWYRSAVAANLVRGFYAETLDHPFVSLPPDHVGTVVTP